MADDGHANAEPPAASVHPAGGHGHNLRESLRETLPINVALNKPNGHNVTASHVMDEIASPTSPRLFAANPFSRKNTSLDIDDYFVRSRLLRTLDCRAFADSELCKPQTGPRDTQKHSKWPIFLRMHGSILPKLILPLAAVAAWTTLFTCISKLVTPRTSSPAASRVRLP
jgi:hypothetical protein